MKTTIQAIALTAALTLSGAWAPMLRAMTVPGHQDRDHYQNGQDHSKYYNNDAYRLGNREGYEDYQRKQQRKEHNHSFHSDNDRQAHDYGYQDGWQGHRYSDRTNNNSERPH